MEPLIMSITSSTESMTSRQRAIAIAVLLAIPAVSMSTAYYLSGKEVDAAGYQTLNRNWDNAGAVRFQIRDAMEGGEINRRDFHQLTRAILHEGHILFGAVGRTDELDLQDQRQFLQQQVESLDSDSDQ